ncbi:MAG: hypothetical protein GY849_22445 [Deltaproteobacteria bacterium]|nr:hypothetical protein [Deltaproteobacteria bacterium]
MYFLKRVLLWSGIAAILYILMGYHFVFFGGTRVRMLKKSHFTLEYTFFSVHGKSNATILAIDELREDGIADLLVDMGKMGERQREELMARYE